MDNKAKWYLWEDIALNHYLSEWYDLLCRNFTIRGWEIDLIVSNKQEVVFVEVKVVDSQDDIYWYITQNKLNFLKKSIDYYVHNNDVKTDYRLDVVFIKWNEIYQVYENVEF